MSLPVSSVSFWFEGILVAIGLVSGLAWLGIRLADRIGLVDRPLSAPHKQHKSPTPVAGGLAFWGALTIAGFFFDLFRQPEILAAYAGGWVVFLFGLLDDFRSQPPLVKFLGQALGAVLLIQLGVSIRILESPEFFLNVPDGLDRALDLLLTVLWVVGITNAFNFVDSMDGLAVGLGGMATGFFMLVTLDAGQPRLSLLSALLFGLCLGLYFFNARPARLFLGDSGAQSLGFVLAALAIAYRPQGVNQSSSWFVPIMLLGVPIFDMALVTLSRLRRKKQVYLAALDHTYHRLLAYGYDSNRSVLVMHGAALMLGCVAFIAMNRPPLAANIIFASCLVLGGLAYLFMDHIRPVRPD